MWQKHSKMHILRRYNTIVALQSDVTPPPHSTWDMQGSIEGEFVDTLFPNFTSKSALQASTSKILTATNWSCARWFQNTLKAHTSNVWLCLGAHKNGNSCPRNLWHGSCHHVRLFEVKRRYICLKCTAGSLYSESMERFHIPHVVALQWWRRKGGMPK